MFAIASSVVWGGRRRDATALSYALSLAVGATGGISGLDSNGASICLHDIGGVITGSTAATTADVIAGNTIFTIAVSGTGVVTLTQFAEIDHAAAGRRRGRRMTTSLRCWQRAGDADGVGDDHGRRRRQRDRQRR